MSWFSSSLKNSIHAFFSSHAPAAPGSDAGDERVGIEDIRNAMLALIAASGGEEQHPHVSRRIRYAGDVKGLWFLRGDLMAVLAGSHGEAAALEKMRTVNDMFHDMLPQGLRSRPSPLGSKH
jgi:hypothetical protein